MKPITIDKLDTYKKFITRGLKPARLISYVPDANEKNRLIFMVEGNIIHTDETGVCWTLNSFDSYYTGSSFRNYDVMVDDIEFGWINLYNNDSGKLCCSSEIYNSFEEAKKNPTKQIFKTIQIQWSIDNEQED
jgi:hypothetical protein